MFFHINILGPPSGTAKGVRTFRRFGSLLGYLRLTSKLCCGDHTMKRRKAYTVDRVTHAPDDARPVPGPITTCASCSYEESNLIAAPAKACNVCACKAETLTGPTGRSLELDRARSITGSRALLQQGWGSAAGSAQLQQLQLTLGNRSLFRDPRQPCQLLRTSCLEPMLLLSIEKGSRT